MHIVVLVAIILQVIVLYIERTLDSMTDNNRVNNKKGYADENILSASPPDSA